jgi:hypothetical protein
MTTADSRVSGPPMAVGRARNDIYTVLLIIAAAFVMTATVYLGYVCYGYYGAIVPLSGG